MKSPDSQKLLWSVEVILITLYLCCRTRADKEIKHNGDTNGAETLEWAVKLNFHEEVTREEYDLIAELLAENLNLTNKGQIGELKGIYLLSHSFHIYYENRKQLLSTADYNRIRPDLKDINENKMLKFLEYRFEEDDSKMSRDEYSRLKVLVHEAFDGHDHVQWYSQQVLLRRLPRSVKDSLTTFDDPEFGKQWHLYNTRIPGNDINVTNVWAHNITGRGVTVSLIDDGVQWDNPDISKNYNPDGSWDLNSEDADPMPHPAIATNGHGTRCAGEIAAVPNSVCGVGVAYGAKVSGIRALDGPITDQLEAKAFTIKLQVNDIFSCSWGPDDDGKTVDGPRAVAKAALRHGINNGRHGYGTIYVVASGNGGRYTDNCNYDGYANSIYTVTIGAVDEQGDIPYYAESCAAILAVTYSSGVMGQQRSIVTTDWTFRGASGCTDQHSGTSAAAPIGAGMIALMLESRPCLTWRDVQHIIAVTSVPVDRPGGQWTTNKAGLKHSYQHGFGLMDAWRLVNGAKVWDLVPFQTSHTSREYSVLHEIPIYPKEVRSTIPVIESDLKKAALYSLEHVVIIVSATHKRRGYMEIRVECPSGTESLLAAPRSQDISSAGFESWTFSTLRCWGENPLGEYKIIATQRAELDRFGQGELLKWSIVLFGSPMSPADFLKRANTVYGSYSGAPLVSNHSLPCSSPPAILSDATHPISDRTLKVLALVSGFCLLLAIYETFEYMCCYDEEKRETKRNFRIAQHMAIMAGESETNMNEVGNPFDSDAGDENTPMLSNHRQQQQQYQQQQQQQPQEYQLNTAPFSRNSVPSSQTSAQIASDSAHRSYDRATNCDFVVGHNGVSNPGASLLDIDDHNDELVETLSPRQQTLQTMATMGDFKQNGQTSISNE